MNYLDQWRAISSRIRGLMRAAEVDANLHAASPSGSYPRWPQLRRQNRLILEEIEKYVEAFSDSIPPKALTAIRDLISEAGPKIRDDSGHGALQAERVRAGVLILGAFETEITFLLVDEQEAIRLRSERAFQHLQRSIVADEDFQSKWVEAYKNGEIACERLGHIHLLLHGIWAFKAGANGGITDLVFQEPVRDLSDEKPYADGIVLTEWKKAKTPEEAASKFEEARYQARDYSQGIMGGAELTAYRYAVVVTEAQVPIPKDLHEDGFVWRHINIAVKPLSPSQVSRKKPAKAG